MHQPGAHPHATGAPGDALPDGAGDDVPLGFCPVCLCSLPADERDEQDDTVCGDCGWPLDGPVLMGPATPQHRAALAGRLAAARRNADLRACSLAAGYPDAGDPTLLARLLYLVRDGGDGKTGPAAEDAVAAVAHLRRRSVTNPDGDRRRRALLAAVEELAEAAERGGSLGPGVLVSEIGREGVGVLQFTVDEHGFVIPAAMTTVPWRALVPSLPEDPDRRLVCLAAGLAVSAGVRAAVEADVAALAARADLLAPLAVPADHVIVLLRVPRWRFGVAVASAYQARLRRSHPKARVQILGDLPAGLVALDDAEAEQVMRRVRIRREHGIALADVHPGDGQVRLRVHRLFRPVDTAESCEPVRLRIRGTATSGCPCLLTLLTASPGPQREWRPVEVRQVELRPGADYELVVALVRPGLVDFSCRAVDGGTLLASTRGEVATFEKARSAKPERYQDVSARLTLWIAIEQGGEPEQVARRVTVVRDLIAAIEREHADPDAVRYGLLVYDDHANRPGAKVVRGLGEAAAPAVLQVLDAVSATSAVSVVTAPLEDALYQAAGTSWRADPGRRVLIVVGSRIAHPAKPNSELHPCPLRLDWRKSLEHLAKQGVDVVAVWDPPAWTTREDHDGRVLRARREWTELGSAALLRLPVSGRRLALAAGALPRLRGPALLFPVVVGQER